MLIDTHCHIHWADFPVPPDEVLKKAKKAGVLQMICVGTDEDTSLLAIKFSCEHPEVFATVGLHPHYASKGIEGIVRVLESIDTKKDIVAIGETGLDYFYNNSPKADQIKVLESQIDLAIKYDLPLIFHVREAYGDFWPVLDNFKGLRGVAHSFTDTMKNAEEALGRGFYIGVNGISTFAKDPVQQEMFTSVPLDRIILETDAPYLTPYPLRGKIKCNEPAFIREIAQYMSTNRQIEFDEVARITTQNARSLFNL